MKRVMLLILMALLTNAVVAIAQSRVGVSDTTGNCHFYKTYISCDFHPKCQKGYINVTKNRTHYSIRLKSNKGNQATIIDDNNLSGKVNINYISSGSLGKNPRIYCYNNDSGDATYGARISCIKNLKHHSGYFLYTLYCE